MAPALDVILDCNRCASDRLSWAKVESDLLSSMKTHRTQPSLPIPWMGKGRPLKVAPQLLPPGADIAAVCLSAKKLSCLEEPLEGAPKPRTLGAVNLPGHSIGIVARAVFPMPVHMKIYPDPIPPVEQSVINPPIVELPAPAPKKIAVNVPSHIVFGEVLMPLLPKPLPAESARNVKVLVPLSVLAGEKLRPSSSQRQPPPEAIHKPARSAVYISMLQLKSSARTAGARSASAGSDAIRVRPPLA